MCVCMCVRNVLIAKQLGMEGAWKTCSKKTEVGKEVMQIDEVRIPKQL